MTAQMTERITIDKVDRSKPQEEWKLLLVDAGRRRHLSYSMDFDTRVHQFEEPNDGWEDDVRRLHLENQENVISGLTSEFGPNQLDKKIENFIAIGSKPFSVLAFHNQYFDEVRRAFVIGAYYPALVSACALGERILNHLTLDLRDFFKHTLEYKKIYRKDSFDNWQVPIDTLQAWGVLLPKAVDEFRMLVKLRHRSIHFNVNTYATLGRILWRRSATCERSLIYSSRHLGVDPGSLRERKVTYS